MMTFYEIVQIALLSIGMLLTALYVVFTYKIMKANTEVAKKMEEQYLSENKPEIIIYPSLIKHSIALYLMIENIGNKPARDLRFSIDKEFYSGSENREESSLSQLPLFTKGISVFSPRTFISIRLGNSISLYNKTNEDLGKYPLEFTITLKYRFNNKDHEETYTINLEPFIYSDAVIDPIAKAIERNGRKN